jgi:outer membrane receptor protein involved in Fe transport
MLSATYGEGPSHGVNGEVLGKFAKLGYYFNVDHLDSDGLWKDRYTRKESFYGKLKLDLAHDIALGLSYSDSFPRYKALEWNADWSDNNKEYIRNHTRFGTLTLDAPLGDSFHLHAAANRFLLNFAMDDNYTAGLENTFGWEEDATEGSLRISWTGAQHSAVLGAETRRGSLDYANDWWQLPAWTNLSHDIASTVEEEQRGVYTNAALTFGDLTLSPGIRHDFNSNSGDTISPSFGAIYRLATHTNIRGTVARGFAAPYLWLLQNPDGGNRDLAQERIWNYQMGIETTYFKSVQLGAMAFHHVIKDAWFLDTASGNADPSNNGKVRRSGGELDIETLPWHQLTFKAAFSAASEDGINYENEEMYGANLTLLFDAPKFCRAKLNGRYVWWNKFTIGSEPGTYDDFVWDLVVDKEIMAKANYRAEVFMSVHNLFNATQSWDVDVAIPQRWVEGGLTLRF